MAFGADRSVAVNLKANVSDYIGKITAASKATKDFSRDAVASAQKHRDSWNKVGNGLLVTGAAIAAGVGLAVKSFADFDAQMSQVKAVSGATAGEMNLLRGAAIAAGRDTKYSAAEAAEAETELAKVGISTADILGGALTGSLNLAAAGNLSLGRAAEISGQAMKIFNLRGKDVGHIADALANGANKSAADVEQLAQALSQGGLVAAQTGLTLDDTVGTLSAFADNALIGSDAGTSFKTMLQRLTPQNQQAAETMKALGLSAYDAQGNFIGITAYAGKLRAALKDASVEQRNAALQTIFGADAIRAATVLYGLGEQGLRGYIDGVKDQGAAARVAAINMDNLKGDIEQLRGSIETALIQSGSGANDVLRDMVQLVTGAVNAFSELPQGLQSGALGLAAVSAAGLLAAGGVVKVVTAAASAKKAIAELGLASKLASSATPVGLAFTAAAVAIGVFAKAQLDAKAKADALRDSLDQQTGAITDNTKSLVAKTLQESGSLTSARALGLSLQDVTDAALGNSDAMKRLRDAQSDLQGVVSALEAKHGDLTQAEYDQLVAGEDQIDMFQALMKSIGATSDVLNPQIQQQKEVAEATGATSGKTKDLAKTETELKDAAKAAAEAHDQLIQAVQSFGQKALDARGAARDYQAALDDATQSVKDNGKTLDTNTAKGRANQVALENIRTTALKSITANAEHGASLKQLDKQVDEARRQFITFATQMGLSKSQANTLATQLGLTRGNVNQLSTAVKNVPTSHKTTITAQTAAAQANIAAVQSRLNALDGKTVTTYIDVRTREFKASQVDRLDRPKKAGGGYISGPGTSTSDSIPAYLSNGEYVVKAAAVERYGKSFFDHVNAMRFASGGYATRAAAPAATPAVAPQVNVSVSAEPGLAREYAGYVARKIVTAQRDAIAVYGLDVI